jgi:hypothetical protein
MRLFMIRGIIGTGAPSEMPLEATDKQSCMLLDPMKASRLSPRGCHHRPQCHSEQTRYIRAREAQMNPFPTVPQRQPATHKGPDFHCHEHGLWESPPTISLHPTIPKFLSISHSLSCLVGGIVAQRYPHGRRRWKTWLLGVPLGF